jgi:hypothetical protein
MRISEITTESVVNELGNRPYPFKIDPNGWKEYKSVTSRDGKINVVFEWRPGSNNGAIDVSFEVNGTQAITGGGDAFRIFSTVAQIIQKRLPPMIRQLEPGDVWFHAHDEASRVSLYDKYAVRFFNQLLGPDWQFKRSINPENRDVMYRWQRIRTYNGDNIDFD